MSRQKEEETQLKSAFVGFLKEKNNYRAAIFEKTWNMIRMDVMAATRDKRLVAAECKSENDTIKIEQILEYYGHVEHLYLVLSDCPKHRKKIEKIIDEIPKECGILFVNIADSTIDTYRESSKRPIEYKRWVWRRKETDMLEPSPWNVNFYFENWWHHLLAPGEISRLMWYMLIIYAKFHDHKSNVDGKISYTKAGKREYLDREASMKRYLTKFFKKCGVKRQKTS